MTDPLLTCDCCDEPSDEVTVLLDWTFVCIECVRAMEALGEVAEGLGALGYPNAGVAA